MFFFFGVGCIVNGAVEPRQSQLLLFKRVFDEHLRANMQCPLARMPVSIYVPSKPKTSELHA